jgi:hypothetical protein
MATPTAMHLGLLAAALSLAACRDVTVPNYNAPNVDQLTQAPTAKVVNGAVLGLLGGERAVAAAYADGLGVLGRESLHIDASESRFVSVWLQGPLTQDVSGFIDFGWSATYRQVRGGYTILAVVDRVTTYTLEQREGVQGVTKTFIAKALIDQLRVRDTFGIVLDIDVTGLGLGALVTRDSGYARAAQLLDDAAAHLAAAGTSFPFTMTAGFNGFNTPASFLKVNRALKARMEAYRGRWADVLAALAESFITTPSSGVPAALQAGAYNSYPTGEAGNGLFQNTPTTLVAVPSFLADAQRRPNGSPDLRASTKAQVTATCLSQSGVSSCVKLTRYASNNADVPIIRNEELILLRAEAQLALGNRSEAINDLNYVRVNAGGLAPLPPDYAGDLVDEVLYNRRYSLFFEYGHRWVDMRRYGRLDQLEKMLPTHRIFALAPLPQLECLARGNSPAGCVSVDGF